MPSRTALQVAVVVLHEDRVMVQPLQPAGAQQVRQAVAALIQLAVGDGLTGAGHDEGWVGRVCFGLDGWVHASSSCG